MSLAQVPTEGDEVMARVSPGEIIPGFVSKVEGDNYTIAVFDCTVEMEVSGENVWLNGGYNIERMD